MDKIIETCGLTKKYGDYTAVNNLNISIAKGEIFGLLGPNGAGKSTTILMLMGLTEPYSGTVNVCGVNPVRYPLQVKRRVGYLPEDVGFYDDYSGTENLIYTALLNDISRTEARNKADFLFGKVGLAEHKDKKVGKYSRGMRQRLGLADALMKDPEVIILDEPTLGIDPAGVKEFLELIVQLSRKEGITVLFSSHHLHQVQQVCDRVGIFVRGNLLAEGNIESLSIQLFSENSYTIEGEISFAGTEKNLQNDSIGGLMKGFNAIEGVSTTKITGTRFLIESKKDVTAEISKFVVHAGFGLNSLNKKVYGLDDIYYKYFQDVDIK